MKITPHIVVPDAAEASEWYARALGAEERSRVTLPSGTVMTLEMRFGESAVMVASEFPDMGVLSPLSIGGSATVLQITTDRVDALWAQAVAAGAEVQHDLADAFWGERHGQIRDPFGNRWNLAQPIREVSPEEIEQAAAAIFEG